MGNVHALRSIIRRRNVNAIVQIAEADFLFLKAVKGAANCVPEFSTTGNPRPKLDLVAEVAPFSFKNHDFAYFYTSK